MASISFRRSLTVASGALLWALLVVCAGAAQTTVGVASNFAGPMKRIVSAFERETGHKVLAAYGSTGQFYAQIRNGAPFDLFLSADDETPAALVEAGLAVAESRATYAVGRLVLWSATPGTVDDAGDILRRGSTERIALADPRLAPYGGAALQTLRALGLEQTWRPRVVTGKNIEQAYQLVATGNAPLGFVALAQVMRDGVLAQGSGWIVPARLHDPLRQDLVVLQRGRDNAAALALARYLRGPTTRLLIRGYGYETE